MNKDIKANTKKNINEINDIYQNIKPEIKTRLAEFDALWSSGSELDIFSELAFCLLTPQSKAKLCWETVEKLIEKDLILNGSETELSSELNKVRFKYTKAKNIIEARKLFIIDGHPIIRSKLRQLDDSYGIRTWLVENVRGMGYKEASHFLRNIGQGGQLAILDRHILRNLCALRVIDIIPSSITKKNYLALEKKMCEFSNYIGIPLAHLDLLLWYKETGEVFK